MHYCGGICAIVVIDINGWLIGYVRLALLRLFPQATRQVAMFAWAFGDCREGGIPRSLLRI
jgi:hypothetical protein